MLAGENDIRAGRLHEPGFKQDTYRKNNSGWGRKPPDREE
jgi:hypothetical protein